MTVLRPILSAAKGPTPLRWGEGNWDEHVWGDAATPSLPDDSRVRTIVRAVAPTAAELAKLMAAGLAVDGIEHRLH